MKSYAITIITIACILLTAKIPAQDISKEYVDLIARADSLVKKSQWNEAEQCFLNAMRREPANPTNVFIMSNVGLIRHYAGNDSAALAILNDAVAIAPSAVTVRANRAKVLSSMGRLEQALDDYSTVLTLDSMIIEPRHMRCIINLSKGDILMATQDVDFLNRHFPDEVETYEATAYLNILTENYAQATVSLGKLIKKQPTATNYGERAYCNLKTGNLNEASADINDAMRLDPANGELYLFRAMLNKMRFRPQDAMNDIREAQRLGISQQRIKELGLQP